MQTHCGLMRTNPPFGWQNLFIASTVFKLHKSQTEGIWQIACNSPTAGSYVGKSISMLKEHIPHSHARRFMYGKFYFADLRLSSMCFCGVPPPSYDAFLEVPVISLLISPRKRRTLTSCGNSLTSTTAAVLIRSIIPFGLRGDSDGYRCHSFLVAFLEAQFPIRFGTMVGQATKAQSERTSRMACFTASLTSEGLRE